MNKKLIGMIIVIIITIVTVSGCIGDNVSDDISRDFVIKKTKTETILVEYTGDGGEVVIPDELNVTVIARSAFKDSNITRIKSNTVKDIPYDWFKGNENLKSVDLSNIETIPFGTFDGCYNLETVNFPKVKTIEKDAFRNCVKLSSFLGNPNITSIEKNVFTQTNGSIMAPLPFDIEKYLRFKTVFVNNSYKEPDYIEEYFDNRDLLYGRGDTLYYSQKRNRTVEGKYHKDEYYTYVKI